MNYHMPRFAEEKIVDVTDLSQKLSRNEYQGFEEMQKEDYSYEDYASPFSYMRDLQSDLRGSIHYTQI